MTLAKEISDQVFAPASQPSPVAASKTCGYQIDRVIQEIDLPAVREIVGTVFQNLLTLLECLDLIETHLRQVDAADETFALFQEIHDEARTLVNFIQNDALSSPLLSESLLDTLDGISFALTHDLQRVFEPNSRSPHAGNPTHVVVGKLYRAHDVLTNCLQQSTITLAMLFDSELVGARLFNNSDMRYRQSLQLCEDITTLIQLIEASEETKTDAARSRLAAGLEEFRQESMECLMYSDWPQFESFCDRIAVLDESQELAGTLHQFRCYLETLLGQVRMRAVLANVFPHQFGECDSRVIDPFLDDNAPLDHDRDDQIPTLAALAS